MFNRPKFPAKSTKSFPLDLEVNLMTPPPPLTPRTVEQLTPTPDSPGQNYALSFTNIPLPPPLIVDEMDAIQVQQGPQPIFTRLSESELDSNPEQSHPVLFESISISTNPIVDPEELQTHNHKPPEKPTNQKENSSVGEKFSLLRPGRDSSPGSPHPQKMEKTIRQRTGTPYALPPMAKSSTPPPPLNLSEISPNNNLLNGEFDFPNFPDLPVVPEYPSSARAVLESHHSPLKSPKSSNAIQPNQTQAFSTQVDNHTLLGLPAVLPPPPPPITEDYLQEITKASSIFQKSVKSTPIPPPLASSDENIIDMKTKLDKSSQAHRSSPDILSLSLKSKSLALNEDRTLKSDRSRRAKPPSPRRGKSPTVRREKSDTSEVNVSPSTMGHESKSPRVHLSSNVRFQTGPVQFEDIDLSDSSEAISEDSSESVMKEEELNFFVPVPCSRSNTYSNIASELDQLETEITSNTPDQRTSNSQSRWNKYVNRPGNSLESERVKNLTDCDSISNFHSQQRFEFEKQLSEFLKDFNEGSTSAGRGVPAAPPLPAEPNYIRVGPKPTTPTPVTKQEHRMSRKRTSSFGSSKNKQVKLSDSLNSEKDKTRQSIGKSIARIIGVSSGPNKSAPLTDSRGDLIPPPPPSVDRDLEDGYQALRDFQGEIPSTVDEFLASLKANSTLAKTLNAPGIDRLYFEQFEASPSSTMEIEEQDSEKTVMYATIFKIISLLTTKTPYKPAHLLQIFLLTFRTFITPKELLELLICRAYGTPLDTIDQLGWSAQSREIRKSVVLLLTTWIKDYFEYDFKNNHQVLRMLAHFVHFEPQDNILLVLLVRSIGQSVREKKTKHHLPPAVICSNIHTLCY
jgi:hypothetical protein